jgi:hypothetical protein
VKFAKDTDVASAVERCEGWLANLDIAASGTGSNLEGSFRSLMGFWICRQARGLESGTSPVLVSAAAGVSNALHEQMRAGKFDPLAYDAKLLLLIHRILSHEGLPAAGLDSFASDLAAALGQLESVPGKFAGEAILLAGLGYPSALKSFLVPGSISHVIAQQLLLADDNELRQVCNDIAAESLFGQRHLRSETPGDLKDVFGLIVLERLRQYDLEMAMAALRARNYLGARKDSIAAMAIDFLLAHQLEDGRFGYLEIEAHHLSHNLRQPLFDPCIGLYLPITVTCLWTLAETAIPKFSLFALPDQ